MTQQDYTIQDAVDIVKRRWLQLLALFVVLFGASVTIAIMLPPIFRSEARILVESQQIPRDLVRSTVTAVAEERIQVIKQRITTRNTILELARKFDLFANRRADLSPTELVFLVRERIDISIYDIGGRHRRRSQNAFTIAFRVGFEYEKPHIAARVAGELVTLILNADVKSRTSRASDTTRFLDREEKRLQRQLVSIEQEISAFKSVNKGALPSQLNVLISALEKAKEREQAIDRDLHTLDERIRLLEFELSVQNSVSSRSIPGAANLGQQLDPLQARLQGLKVQLSEKSQIYSDKHPDIRGLKAQIEALEQQIEPRPVIESTSAAELTPTKIAQLETQSRVIAEKISTVQSRKQFLISQKKQTEKNISEIAARVEKVPEVENGLAILERRQAGTQKELTEISQKLSQAKLGERLEADQQAERLQVLEQPVTPQEPIKPNRKNLVALGFAVSAAISGGLVTALELLDKSVRSSNDLVNKLNKRALVVIPYIHTRNERRQRFLLRLLMFLIVITIGVVAVLGVHYFYMPLDILIPKVMRRLNF